MSPLLGKFRDLHPGVGIEAVIGVGGETLLYSRISHLDLRFIFDQYKIIFFHNGGYSSIRKIVIQWGQVRVGIAI